MKIFYVLYKILFITANYAGLAETLNINYATDF